MKLYKLTDENDQSYNQTQWGRNRRHQTNGKGELCGPGWLHAYTHPLLAVFLNPIHADFKTPHLWEATGIVRKTDYGLKVGVKQLTTIRRLRLPKITTNQRIRFAILCAKGVCTDPTFVKWADNWLSGKDRTKAAARAAWAAARAAEAAARAAEAAGAAGAAVHPLDLIFLAKLAMKED
jgi:hypothetical protein